MTAYEELKAEHADLRIWTMVMIVPHINLIFLFFFSVLSFLLTILSLNFYYHTKKRSLSIAFFCRSLVDHY